jgi:hypothetical protein
VKRYVGISVVVRRTGERIIEASRKYGTVVLLTFASQALSALNLSLLSFIGLKVSDLYSVAIQAGTSAYASFIVGVLYLLAVGRPNFKRWYVFAGIGSFFSIILAIGSAYMIMGSRIGLSFSLLQIILVFGSFAIGGAALSFSSTSAVRQACLGHPTVLVGITIFPNFCMLIATVVAVPFIHGNELFVCIPAIFWAGANLIQTAYVFITSRNNFDPRIQNNVEREGRVNELMHTAALVIGSVTSTFLPSMYIAATAKLASGATTVLYFGGRIGAAVIGLCVNSILMVRYNWKDRTPSESRASIQFMLITVTSGVIALVMKHAANLPYLGYVIVLLAWMSSLVAAPLVMREANARRLAAALMGKSVFDLGVSVCVAYILYRMPSVTGYFSAYMASQCISTLFCGIGLGDRRLWQLSAIGLSVSLCLLLGGW